jgi:hypothetical protein
VAPVARGCHCSRTDHRLCRDCLGKWFIAGNGTADRPRVDLAVRTVERAFVSRPFGGSLPIVLVDIEATAPSAGSPTISFSATGSDGRIYKGALPLAAKICGLADYVGDPAGGEVEKTVAFIVPREVHLLNLQWRGVTDRVDNVIDLPAATVVCSP